MDNYKLKQCKCGIFFKQFNSFQKFCSAACKFKYGPKVNLKLKPMKPIPKVSKKRQIQNLQYSVLRTEFLGKKENQICPITGKPTTDIHHKKGRVGELFLDTKYWVALSREGHRFVEENPEWAKEKGYSLNRLTDE